MFIVLADTEMFGYIFINRLPFSMFFFPLLYRLYGGELHTDVNLRDGNLYSETTPLPHKMIEMTQLQLVDNNSIFSRQRNRKKERSIACVK